MSIGSLQLRDQRRKDAPPYTPTMAEKDAIEVIRRHWAPNDPLRMQLEQTWLTNIAFLIGFQYLTWDPLQRQMVYAQAPSLRWRARAVHNLIRAYVEQDVASAGQFDPEWSVRPANTDPENQDAAEANEAVLTHYWRETRMKSKKYDLFYWTFVTGNAFVKAYWDKCAGEQMRIPGTATHDGVDVQTAERLFLGDIASEIISPLEIYVDNYARRFEDLRWMIHARAVPIEYIEEHWPEMAPYVQSGVDEDGVIGRQRFVLDIMGPAGSYSSPGSNTNRNENWVILKEYFERPSFDFPNGRYIVEANGICLEQPRDNPTPNGDLPFVWVRHMLVPGRLWAQCNVDNLLSLQRSYNRYCSKTEEHVVLTANSKLLEHATNELPNSAYDTEIGEVIKWSGVERPEFLQMPSLPQDIYREMERCKQDFDTVSSQSSVVRGQYPGRVSGKMVNILVEQNNMLKTPFLARLAEDFKWWGHLVLEIAQANIAEPRLIKMVGRDRQWIVKEFQGQDVKGNTEVEIDLESVMPKSLTMTMDFITQMTNLGWLQPMNAEHAAKVWRSVGMRDLTPLVEDKTLDVRRARNENKMVMAGMMIQPAQLSDDHELHVQMHGEQQKGDDYAQAPAVVKMMLEAHIASHFAFTMPRAGVTVRQGMAGPGQEPDEMGMDAPQQQQVQFNPQRQQQPQRAGQQAFT